MQNWRKCCSNFWGMILWKERVWRSVGSMLDTIIHKKASAKRITLYKHLNLICFIKCMPVSRNVQSADTHKAFGNLKNGFYVQKF